ncbi:DUF2280 domain-containing protein [Novosphingobium sp.]|uniref:DUF2280 domain-containing protein n=1 Tax=Novosphingobium sp. TaxID=1874826 RepID=UPI002611E8D9|nr:DUF2280 domain-containing protein [Novosphingobium sp.]
MRRLADAIKRRIVEHLACYCSPAEVVDLIAQEFDVNLTPRHVRAYDPTSFQYAGSHLWLEYHQLVRGRYQEEIGEIAITHRAYRLKRLQQLYEIADQKGDVRQAAAMLEQAAKEVGGMYGSPAGTRRPRSASFND